MENILALFIATGSVGAIMMWFALAQKAYHESGLIGLGFILAIIPVCVLLVLFGITNR